MSFAGQSRWLSVLLLVSLAGNLFFGGIAAARWFTGSDRSSAVIAPSVTVRAVPRENRKVLEDAIASRKDQIAPALGATKQARVAVRDALVAEPFSAAALDTAYATLRERSIVVQQKYHEATIEAAAQLPVAVRRAMARGDAKASGDKITGEKNK